MRRRQHELKVDSARPVLQLVVLNAVQLVGDVSSPHVHLWVTGSWSALKEQPEAVKDNL